MKTEGSRVVEITKDYYDSKDANNFYFHVWGGEDIHIGVYRSDTEAIFDASQRTVQLMIEKLPKLNHSHRVLDMGSGFGGSARYLVKQYQCQVECLNLSQTQNEVNRRLNREQQLDHKINVVEGNFEELPFADSSFDLVWSQDSILHSGRREQVLKEAFRVLRPGGVLIFTDPMQDESAATKELKPVLDRIHLASLSRVDFYIKTAKSIGFSDHDFDDYSGHLATHYSRVLGELNHRESEMANHCSADYMEKMKKGLEHWIDAGKKGLLRWGIFRFTK